MAPSFFIMQMDGMINRPAVFDDTAFPGLAAENPAYRVRVNSG